MQVEPLCPSSMVLQGTEVGQQPSAYKITHNAINRAHIDLLLTEYATYIMLQLTVVELGGLLCCSMDAHAHIMV